MGLKPDNFPGRFLGVDQSGKKGIFLHLANQIGDFGFGQGEKMNGLQARQQRGPKPDVGPLGVQQARGIGFPVQNGPPVATELSVRGEQIAFKAFFAERTRVFN
jgi:hypothetical protein